MPPGAKIGSPGPLAAGSMGQMTSFISHTSVDCADAYALSSWWRAVLDYVEDPDDPNEPGHEECMIYSPGRRHRVLFIEVPEPKQGKNRIHFDLRPRAGSRDEELARLTGLGATQVGDLRKPDGTGWVVLADPEGNEFCILRGDSGIPNMDEIGVEPAGTAQRGSPSGSAAQSGSPSGAGATVGTEDRIDRARLLYERAVFGGDTGVLATAERELDAVEADLALARGRVIHARFLAERSEDPQELPLFERAARLYQLLGDVRGEAEALFWIGCFHQVVREDPNAALPALDRSYELATQAGDKLTLSYALRHLGMADYEAGRLDTARARLEESVRLRRDLRFMPGVAANLVGLAYIAAAQGRRDQALTLIEEAGAIAEASGADRIMRSAEEARSSL